jgi:hypothetical protein
VGYGRDIPEGSLPVFSVDTEKEAKMLIVAACQTNISGEYIAKELAREQTLENLEAFSNRLAETWELIKPNEQKSPCDPVEPKEY